MNLRTFCSLLVYVVLASACSFNNLEPNAGLVVQTVKYVNPAAHDVALAWGVEGWNQLPSSQLSDEVYIQNKIMHQHMQRDNGAFTVDIYAPPDATVNFGFLILKDASDLAVAIWDGDYETLADGGSAVEINSALTDSATASDSAQISLGKELFSNTCTICHGANGEGIPTLGKDLTNSAFIRNSSNEALAAFIKEGRAIDHPDNTTGVVMPAQPNLDGDAMAAVVAYVRTLDSTATPQHKDVEPVFASETEPAVVDQFSIDELISLAGQYPTSLTFGDDNVLYVASYTGEIWSTTVSEDGQADTPLLFEDKLENPVGLAWFDGELYIASQGKISAHKDTDNDGKADEQRDIVTGLPANIYPVHANNDLVIGPDERLYFSVGSTTNASEESYEFAASLLSVNLDGTDLQIEARGLRNSYDLAFNNKGALFATDNAPDGGEWEEKSPPGEFNHIIRNGNYGFPNYFGVSPVNSNTQDPTLTFPSHSAPSGITFYHANHFPSEFNDNAFIALWTKGQIFRVKLVEAGDNEYLASASMFASGISGAVDVVVGPFGYLYVTASENAKVYRIQYQDG